MFKPKFKFYKDFRETSQYKARKRVVKNGWIIGGMGLAVLAQIPSLLGLVLGIVIGGTCLSFAFLEEPFL